MAEHSITSIGEVQAAYGARALEYANALGALENLAEADLTLVADWAKGIAGRVVDVGSGPGQWTQYLHRLGVRVSGIDPVPEFVELASAAYPEVSFEVGRAENTLLPKGTLGGVLAWYSLIHTEPLAISQALQEFHRILRPGGGLALGFFEGLELEPFEHAITTAWFWPMQRLVSEVEAAGFTVTHTETRTDPGSRRHGAITALRE
ncbi:MAG TPA: class I SAM-dependent methyltransferase [Candidatus Nesterenkonia stercoripullorum]|uniref:Class I SAM-dependent methyltransferase n=1 Tax=Candidatus Nesterenkonia stercoripullorum TaxID=2838701 RepID=A0A9D1UTE7_9MICC|nr:class I SAM-dependent methyltransferase [Candidatus Nesterenkonia stercoripullorum]